MAENQLSIDPHDVPPSEIPDENTSETMATDEQTKKITLSPSGASTFRQCPKKWEFRYIKKIREPSGYPAVLGGFVHSVLEKLMELEPKERTKENAKSLTRENYDNELNRKKDFLGLNLDEESSHEFRWAAWNSIMGLWALENPTEVKVLATEKRLKVPINGVEFYGIVDRIDQEEDGSISIVDYKTGKLPKVKKGRDEKLDQVFLYAAAFRELEGETPKQVKLYFPSPSTNGNGTSNAGASPKSKNGAATNSGDVTPEKNIICGQVDGEVLEKTIGELESTHDEIQVNIRTSSFEAKTGPLCGWCFYVDQCEKGKPYVTNNYYEGRINDTAPAIKILGLKPPF